VLALPLTATVATPANLPEGKIFSSFSWELTRVALSAHMRIHPKSDTDEDVCRIIHENLDAGVICRKQIETDIRRKYKRKGFNFHVNVKAVLRKPHRTEFRKKEDTPFMLYGDFNYRSSEKMKVDVNYSDIRPKVGRTEIGSNTYFHRQLLKMGLKLRRTVEDDDGTCDLFYTDWENVQIHVTTEIPLTAPHKCYSTTIELLKKNV
jgi:hypothetical protein